MLTTLSKLLGCVAFAVAGGVAFGQVTAVRDALPPPLPPTVEAPRVVAPVTPVVEQSIAGQVLRTKQVDVRGTAEKMLIALLDIGGGQRQIVDLGPTVNYRVTPIYSGDQIAVHGPRVMLGEHSVLLATTVAAGGEEFSIRRATPAAAVAVAPGYPVINEVRRLDGRLNQLRSSRLRDSREEHMVGELVTRTGQTLVVDFGPPSALWRASMRPGDWITIQGQDMNVNNQPVLLALEVNRSGVTYTIERKLVQEPAIAAVAEPVPVIVPTR